ncbi:hypothetical protein [Streptomyces chartreusis]|uniref:hypothetical protein n=1 Tax=Streptomyces chartreusis TaxID=1969 RepID=UPI0038089321
MSKRYVIDCRELWEQVVGEPGGMRAVHMWLRLHGISPDVVPLDSEMVIEDSAFGMVIRYTAFLLNEDGRKYYDPAGEDAASQARTAVLRFAPEPRWLSTAGGER